MTNINFMLPPPKNIFTFILVAFFTYLFRHYRTQRVL
nr:MAG TPA: hypothetical protein [Caudoviricetes sp.]